MKTQCTLNISIPKDEISLYNELVRVSNLTYTPTSMLCRRFIREGLQRIPSNTKLTPAYR